MVSVAAVVAVDNTPSFQYEDMLLDSFPREEWDEWHAIERKCLALLEPNIESMYLFRPRSALIEARLPHGWESTA